MSMISSFFSFLKTLFHLKFLCHSALSYPLPSILCHLTLSYPMLSETLASKAEVSHYVWNRPSICIQGFSNVLFLYCSCETQRLRVISIRSGWASGGLHPLSSILFSHFPFLGFKKTFSSLGICFLV